MLDLLIAGGWVMPLIVCCSIVAVSICIERYLALDHQKIAPPHLLATVWRDLKQGELNAKKLNELRAGSPLGAILAAGISNRGQGRDVMKESISEAASHVVHDLEKYLNSLGTVAAITPLLGLLGTVVGMIDVFTQITTVGRNRNTEDEVQAPEKRVSRGQFDTADRRGVFAADFFHGFDELY